MAAPWARHWYANLAISVSGVPAFFTPRAIPWGGIYAPLGVYASSWYRTEALAQTLAGVVAPELFAERAPRLTVGAVGVTSGELAYFDSAKCKLELEHIMASGALPPAFPAIRVEGEPYWDGGIYSNTPIEAVMDYHPPRHSVIFNVNVWQSQGTSPNFSSEGLGRAYDIPYACRAP